MPNIKTGVPTVAELREGVTEYRYIPSKGLVSYTKYNNRLYSSKQFQASSPPDVDRKAISLINNSTSVNITTTSDGTSGTSSLDIDELNALGGTGLHQTQDHFVFSDNGTEKKITFSNLEDAIFSNMNSASSDVSVAAGGAITIANDAVSLAKMAGLVRGKFIVGDASGNPSALAAGANGKILVADANGDPSWTTLSGDASISAGTLAIASDVIVNADVKSDAAIAVSKLALTAGDGLTLTSNDMDLDAGLTTVTSIKNNSLIIGGNSQNNTIDFGTDDVILFDTDNTERMRVDAAGIDVTGNITISDAGTIGSASDTDAMSIASGGDVTFSQDIKLGTYSSPNFSNGLIGSSSFTTGFAGGGWQIDHSSNDFTIELDNMFLRGTLSVYELLIQQIRATNGAVFVTSAAKVLSVSGLSTSDDDGEITFEDPSGNAVCPFAVGDIIMMQKVVPGALVAGDAAGNASNVIKKCVYKVTHIGEGANANNVASVDNISYDNLAIPVAGDEFVRIGNVGASSGGDDDRRGLLYLTSDDSNAPFMDVKDEVDSYADWHSTATTKVRVGKLSGITDSGLNAGSGLSGYGLYGGNVYLKGEITARSGLIGADASGDNAWKIEESKIYNNQEQSYLSVDGVNDYLALGDTDASSDIAITSSNGPLTVAFWINFPTSNVIEVIMASHDNNDNYAGWWIQKDSTNIMSMHWGKGSGGTGSNDRQSRSGSTVLHSDTWYFIVMSTDFGDDTIADNYIYINGITSDSITMSGTASMTTPGYAPAGGSVGKIGGEIFDTDSYGQFKMKNIAVWNTLLDSDDISTLYNNGNYFSFASNSGGYDKASNLKMHIDFTTGSENDLTTNIGDSDTVLTNGASIINTSTSFIGLVQENASVLGSSSFYAGATANTGANASISFGTDGKIRGNGIYVKNNLDYLITASRIFGNGSDGSLTLSSSSQTSAIDSVNWIASGALQRDIYATNLTINAGIDINTNGYRIFVRDTLQLVGTGSSFYNNGSTGDAGSHGSSGTGGGGGSGSGAGAAQGSLLGGVAGGAGGAGGNGQTIGVGAVDGTASASITAKTNCVRVYTTNDGARGGDGQDGAGSGANSATRSGTASSEGNISITNADLTYIIAMRDFFTIDGTSVSLFPASGALGGGGGGGGGIASDDQYGGGGGGGGQAGGSGGHVMIVARQILAASGRTLADLTIQAKGGTGGQAGRGASGASVGGGTNGGIGGAGAGGNGGDGGCITLITGTDPGTSGSGGITIDASGGAAGGTNSGGSGNIGTVEAGEPGTTIICHV